MLLAARTDQAPRPRVQKPTDAQPSRGLRFTDTTYTRQNQSGAKISAAERWMLTAGCWLLVVGSRLLLLVGDSWQLAVGC